MENNNRENENPLFRSGTASLLVATALVMFGAGPAWGSNETVELSEATTKGETLWRGEAHIQLTDKGVPRTIGMDLSNGRCGTSRCSAETTNFRVARSFVTACGTRISQGIEVAGKLDKLPNYLTHVDHRESKCRDGIPAKQEFIFYLAQGSPIHFYPR